MSALKEKTGGLYLPFLAEFARGVVGDPQLQCIRSIAALTGTSERPYEEAVKEWMASSFEFYQQSLGWLSDEDAEHL